MSDCCNMSGWIFLPSVLQAMRRNMAAVGKLFETLGIDMTTPEEVENRIAKGELIHHFEVDEVDYAAEGELEGIAENGLIGEFNNGPGDGYGSGVSILDGRRRYIVEEDELGETVLSADNVFAALSKDEKKKLLPEGYVAGLRMRLCPEEVQREWMDALYKAMDKKSADEKIWRKLVSIASKTPYVASIVLLNTKRKDDLLIQAVSRDPATAREVLRARPELRHRRLELAAAGVDIPALDRGRA